MPKVVHTRVCCCLEFQLSNLMLLCLSSRFVSRSTYCSCLTTSRIDQFTCVSYVHVNWWEMWINSGAVSLLLLKHLELYNIVINCWVSISGKTHLLSDKQSDRPSICVQHSWFAGLCCVTFRFECRFMMMFFKHFWSRLGHHRADVLHQQRHCQVRYLQTCNKGYFWTISSGSHILVSHL